MPLKIDTSKVGFRMILKEYQEQAFRYLWGLGGESTSSKDVWVNVNKALHPKTISRAAIILFLDAMADEGIIERTETTGKGGGRRIFRMKFDESGFKEYVAKVTLRSLLRDFPQETRRAVKDVV